MTFLIAYLGSLAAFLILDMLWILVIARNFYRREMSALLREDFLFVPAALFYLVYVAILTYLITIPAVEAADVMQFMIASALFGLAAYGTYDISNYALLKHWSPKVTIVDIIWGMFITTASAFTGFMAVSVLG